jgi:L-2-hydroxyglutarate oxidase LhgO
MDFDIIIIGAGVVGLATAEIFSHNKYRVLIIEKENKIGTGISSRNSEVIHAGIYYPKDSLKSKLCIKGKNLLYDWCEKKKVSYKRLGKYIIAVNRDEFNKLEIIKNTAALAGMDDLVFKGPNEILLEEPDILTLGGLYSPSSGIVSAHELMDSFKNSAQGYGADFLFNAKVKAITKNSQSTGYLVEVVDTTNEVYKIDVARIINCAGLYSDQVARILGTFEFAYTLKFVKGNYFKLVGHKYNFKHLVYPVPLPKLHGLGVHITLDLNGQVKFGPDVQNLSGNVEDYSVDEKRKNDFYEAIKLYLPSIELNDLESEMSGIRPRLAADKEFNDFIINEETEKGFPGIIDCLGIESPGLTASMAIAEYIYNI